MIAAGAVDAIAVAMQTNKPEAARLGRQCSNIRDSNGERLRPRIRDRWQGMAKLKEPDGFLPLGLPGVGNGESSGAGESNPLLFMIIARKFGAMARLVGKN
jgi:hypothetical protein